MPALIPAYFTITTDVGPKGLHEVPSVECELHSPGRFSVDM